MKIFLSLLAVLLAAAFCLPPNTATLTGKITDENGEAIIGASVTVKKKGDTVGGTVTDASGIYRLSLAPDVYDLEFSSTGYRTEKVNSYMLPANSQKTLDVYMRSEALLQEAVVTEYKAPLIQQDNTSSGQTIRMAGTTAPVAKRSKSEGRPANLTTRNAMTAGKPAPTSPRAENRFSALPRDTALLPPDFSAENYAAIRENAFLETQAHPVSTFSIDVDAASYSNARRFLQRGQLPPADAVRIEEFVNYFDYQYPAPAGADPFSVNTELAICPWNPDHRLLLIGLQGREIETGQLTPGNFVFLVDVSGSMNSPDKLPLVQQSLSLLADNLRPHDRVALVAYAGAAGLVLPSTAGTDKASIKAAIENLSAGGSTAGAAGIQLAYQVARKNFIRGGNNRVILCTDGDFNVGVSSENELVKLIETERESGVFLTVLGFGSGNYQDNKMQQLANKGNGNHAYIDQLGEARKVLISEFGGTLFTIAKDVKLQLEFNPARVAGYRLIGYENRLLAREDFDDDAKDAGELGAGHRVTALYEIVPAGRPLPLGVKNGEMRYQQVKTTAAANSDELLALKLRYKAPKVAASSRLMETIVSDKLTANPSVNFELAAAAAQFGLLLRNSAYKGQATYERCLALAQKAARTDPGGYRKELCELIDKARLLAAAETARR